MTYHSENLRTARELSIETDAQGQVWAFFNSNGRRVKRRIMPGEKERAVQALGDDIAEDLFCYSIV